MRGPRIFGTRSFRIVLVYSVIFAFSAALLVAFTWWNTARALDAETDQTIQAEIAGLAEQYQQLGLAGLTNVIVSRSMRGGLSIYLLTDSRNHFIAGNLDGWPDLVPSDNHFVEFDYDRGSGAGLAQHRARGRVFNLTGGFKLLVARDVAERKETERLFTTTLPWSAALMLALGLLGGAIMSRNALRRLEDINRRSRQIMEGDLSLRLPITRAGDEFDTLAGNLNRMLERTERLMKGMREMTDSVAHDLRTPLNRLRNRLEGALAELDPDSPQWNRIESAVAETDRLIGTFNALLMIAEAEAGVVREAMAAVSLPAIVAGVVELYEPLAEEKGIPIEVAPSGAATIQGNRSLISQALANLLDNAIKYSPPGAHVRVAVEDTPSGVALSVADTGPGIPVDDRARVTERFVRLEASRNSPGTGLGLSLVAAVARMHDARLEFGDNNPGLKVTLVFPASPNRKVQAAA